MANDKKQGNQILEHSNDKKRKHHLQTYEQRKRQEELEERLFGSTTASLAEFGNEQKRNAERLPNSAQLEEAPSGGQEGPLIIWEERRPDGGNLSGSEDDVEDQESSEEDESESGGSDNEKLSNSASSEIGSSDQDQGSEDGEVDEQAAKAQEARDTEPATGSDSDGDSAPEDQQAAPTRAGAPKKRKAVWEDPDDKSLQVDIAAVRRLRKLRSAEAETTITGQEYSKRLKIQHAKLHPRTSWASLKQKGKRPSDLSDDEAENMERIQQGASNLLTGNSRLPAGLLEVTRVKDANQQEPCQAVVQSVEFHPGGQLLMTAALDKHLRFFQVDGVKNPKVQSVYLADMPVHKAAFADNGTKVIATGRRKHFYVFDLEAAKVERVGHLAGRLEKSRENFAVSPDPGTPLVAFLGARGYISLLSLRSARPVATLKMPASVRSAAFTDDGTYLFASGGDGVVHTWDMRTRLCVSRFVDEGTLKGISLASSPGQRYLAAGSDAGFVNIYNQKAAIEAGTTLLDSPISAARVPPLRTLKNLTTAVDNLVFSPDGQVLAMSSKLKKDALRLVHTGTMTVFANWPSSRSPLNSVHSTAFSPNGGFFAVGNAKGKVLLYRMHHYSQI